MTEQVGTITWISGPVVRAAGSRQVSMLDLVEVGEEHLVGEVIGLVGDIITIQVYEETSGMQPGHRCLPPDCRFRLSWARAVRSIFDGVQRPLPVIEMRTGSFIRRGTAPDPPLPQRPLGFHAAQGRR